MNPVHIILALSVLANAALGWAYLGQRDKAAKASADLTHMQQQRDGARGAASACSDSVEALQEQAAQRARGQLRIERGRVFELLEVVAVGAGVVAGVRQLQDHRVQLTEAAFGRPGAHLLIDEVLPQVADARTQRLRQIARAGAEQRQQIREAAVERQPAAGDAVHDEQPLAARQHAEPREIQRVLIERGRHGAHDVTPFSHTYDQTDDDWLRRAVRTGATRASRGDEPH